MRHYDDEDEKKAYRPGKRVNDGDSKPGAEKVPAPGAEKVLPSQSPPPAAEHKAAPGGRKIYRGSSAASMKKSMTDDKKPQPFDAEEQSLEAGPSVRDKTSISKARPTTLAAARAQTQPGAERVSGRQEIAFDPEDDDDVDEEPSRGAESTPDDDSPEKDGAEGIPTLQYARAEVVKEPIAVAALVHAGDVEEVGVDKPSQDPSQMEERVGPDDGQKKNKKCIWISVGVGVLVVVIIGVIIGVVAGKDSGGTNTEEDYINLIQSRSPSTSFADSSSPQRLTLDWMLQDTTTSEIKDDDRIIQRFAVGTLLQSFGFNIFEEASPNECDLRGAGCISKANVVDRISFPSQNLDGSVPREIGLLTALTWLDLSGNGDLSGWLPSELSKLDDLKTLLLYDTALTGSIPFNLCGELEEAKIECASIVCECCQCA